MIISFASRRGSPGVSTLTALFASGWVEPNTTRLLIEGDEAGGVLAARWNQAHSLTWTPGLIDMATSPSHDLETLRAHSQALVDGLGAVPAPPGSLQVVAALRALGEEGVEALAGLPGLRAFVDCGRLLATSPAMLFARRSAVTVLVCRPLFDEITSMMTAADELKSAGLNVVLVVVGKGQWPAEKIAERAGLPLLGSLPDDPKGARHITENGLHRLKKLERSPLGKAMPDLVSELQGHCADWLRPPAAHAEAVPQSGANGSVGDSSEPLPAAGAGHLGPNGSVPPPRSPSTDNSLTGGW